MFRFGKNQVAEKRVKETVLENKQLDYSEKDMSIYHFQSLKKEERSKWKKNRQMDHGKTTGIFQECHKVPYDVKNPK